MTNYKETKNKIKTITYLQVDTNSAINKLEPRKQEPVIYISGLSNFSLYLKTFHSFPTTLIPVINNSNQPISVLDNGDGTFTAYSNIKWIIK